jgi:tetratricopeptide (TPR) repeat protein
MLLRRAVELVRPHRIDVTLELESLMTWDPDLRAAAERAEAVTGRAEAAGDPSGAALARAIALYLRGAAGGPDATDELIALCRSALPLEEERGDPHRLALLWDMLASAANFHQQHDDTVEASLQALRYQRLAGYSRSDTQLELALIIGPRPVGEAMRTLDQLTAWRPPGSQDQERATLLAMLGRFDEAWPLAQARSSHLREMTGNTSRAAHRYLGMIATIQGDRERAVQHGTDELQLIPDIAVPAATAKARLARELCYLERFAEAGKLLDEARTIPPPGSGVRVMAAAAEALLLAHQGDLEKAETLARTAVTTAETRTDNIWWQAHTREDLATVLNRAGRTDEAREALERALAIWELKECIPCAARVRVRIDSLPRTRV